MANDTNSALLQIFTVPLQYDQASLLSERKGVYEKILELFQDWCTELYEQQHADSTEKVGTVLPFGSYRLGVEDHDSDIDLLCISPGCILRRDFEEHFTRILEAHSDVASLTCIFTAKVPIVKLEVDGINVDLLFASISSCSEIANEWREFWDDRLVMDCDEATALSLNGVRNTEMILQLIPNLTTFRSVLRSVKLWAKKRGLYSNILGFLGGAAWSILVAKVCITYPDLSPASALGNFFKYFSAWDWSRPVALTPYEEPLYQPHWKTWSPSDRAYVTILTPAFPVCNAAYGVCQACPGILTEEFELAAKITEDVLSGSEEWTILFQDLDFFQQFSYFLEVDILGSDKQEFQEWHGLVLSKFKGFMNELETLAPKTDLRLYPKPYEIVDETFHSGAVYFIGLKFQPAAGNMDLRMPVINFCSRMDEYRRNKPSVNVRVRLQRRSQLPDSILRQLQSPSKRGKASDSHTAKRVRAK